MGLHSINGYGRRLDLIVVQKDKNICQIIDFACPYDGRVDTKKLEIIQHYQDLARELRNLKNINPLLKHCVT